MKRKALLATACLAAALMLAACASTSLTKVYSDPSYSGGKLSKIMVVGVSEKTDVRKSFEDDFAAALAKHKVMAKPSYRLIPAAKENDPKAVLALANKAGVQAVLVTHYKGTTKTQQYMPPPTPFYGGHFGSYYGPVYGYVHQPGGYYRTVKFVKLESKLYSVPAGKLIWSADSDTFEPGGMKDLTSGLAEAVAGSLQKSGLIN